MCQNPDFIIDLFRDHAVWCEGGAVKTVNVGGKNDDDVLTDNGYPRGEDGLRGGMGLE